MPYPHPVGVGEGTAPLPHTSRFGKVEYGRMSSANALSEGQKEKLTDADIFDERRDGAVQLAVGTALSATRSHRHPADPGKYGGNDDSQKLKSHS